MDRFRNILVSITGEPSRQALLDRAAGVSQEQNKARITLAAVVDDLPWYTRLVLPSAEESNRTLVREQSEALKLLAAPSGRTASMSPPRCSRVVLPSRTDPGGP